MRGHRVLLTRHFFGSCGEGQSFPGRRGHQALDHVPTIPSGAWHGRRRKHSHKNEFRRFAARDSRSS